MTKQVTDGEVMYHTGLSKNMVEGAEYVVLPGDPGRVESLAKAFDPKAKHVGMNREHNTWIANFHGQKVLVCSTGLGAPSTGIAVEELATIGLGYMLRVGTCGGIQAHTNLGDIIISSGGVRLEGTSSHYAPMEYPAVASIEFTNDMVAAAAKAEVPYHVGITASSDTFWPGQERYDNYEGHILRRWHGSMAEWRHLKVLNFEMEVSCLFVMASVFGLQAACICGVIAKRDHSEKVELDSKGLAQKRWEKVTVEGIYTSMKRRGLIKQ